MDKLCLYWGKACLDEACDYRLTHSSSGPCLLLLYHWTSQASQLKSCERFTHLCLVVHRPLHSLHYCTEWRYDPTLVNRFQSTWEHPPPYHHSWGERSGVMEWHSLTHSPISIEVWSSYWETKVLSKLREEEERYCNVTGLAYLFTIGSNIWNCLKISHHINLFTCNVSTQHTSLTYPSNRNQVGIRETWWWHIEICSKT